MCYKVSILLKEIASEIGQGIYDISFAVNIREHGIRLTKEDFNLSVGTIHDGIISFIGRWRDIGIKWEFKKELGGYSVRLSAESNYSLNIDSIESLIFKYKPYDSDYLNWRILRNSSDYVNNPIGFPTVKDIYNTNISCKMITGIFPDNRRKGLFVGTVIPQSNNHNYELSFIENEEIIFICTTSFPSSLSGNVMLNSEITWICGSLDVKEAFNTYASFIPELFGDPKPVIGWNSWDYYYFTISLDALIENIEEIKKDPILSEKIHYIVVDDGWEHMPGEWKLNYKFPCTFEKLAREISDRGFIPGIWTAPLLINPASYPAMRMPEIMIKNQYGDPFLYNEYYLLDPTSPAGKEFIKELYTILYNAGFRLFKVDYVSYLLKANRFYDSSKGPYDALRDLFKMIRECVTDESHIIGCSLPPECGPGLSDSGRTGIDIHNQWNHLEWAVECYTFKYWMNKRIWVNDIDFLVVRGKETSLEEETNVLNPNENNPNSPRWRRGPTFTLKEAQTWTNIVMMTGGNIFLSDRISMLNEAGKKLIYKGLENTGVAAQPLDLCCGYHASLWLQEMKDEYRLTIINWNDDEGEIRFRFKEFDLEEPDEVTDIWTDKIYKIKDGVFKCLLEGHESIVISWSKI